MPKVSTAEIETLLDESLSFIATTNAPSEIKRPIESRLAFRKSVLKALEQDAGPLKDRVKSSLLCVPFLRKIRDTSEIGIPVNESFSTKIQRTLASSVPPRPMVTIKLSDALAFFEKLCSDAADVDQILDTDSGEDLSTTISVFMSRIPQPSAYIRAVVQSFLLDRATELVLGKVTPKQFLLSSVEAMVLANSSMLDPANDLVEVPTSPQFEMARLVMDFDARVSQQYLNVFRNSCLNRCRTRRTLCHLVLDWDALQADAEDLDDTMRIYTEERPEFYASDQPTYSYPFSSWIYHHKLNHVRQIVQMGFELTIYAPEEIAGMYWYLSMNCATHLAHIDRITFFLQQDMEVQDALYSSSDGVNRSEMPHRAAFQRTLKNLLRIYTQLRATETFSRALHMLHALLLRHKAIKKPRRPYSSDQLRYELRMKPFLSLSVPEAIVFEVFQAESSLVDQSDEQVLEEAENSIAEARRFWDEVLRHGWSAKLSEPTELDRSSTSVKIEARKGATTIEAEWIKSTKNVIRACIATSIAIAILKKRMDKKEALKDIKVCIPVPGEKDCWHDWWIVPKVIDAA